MNEDYKICPYCNNAVDKKDKQCPYCLKSLSRRNSGNTQTTNNSTNTENVDRDSGIKDNKGGNNVEIPPLLQKLFDTQKFKIGGININGGQKTTDPDAVKKIRRFFIIFFLVIRGIPFIIGIITSIFGD